MENFLVRYLDVPSQERRLWDGCKLWKEFLETLAAVEHNFEPSLDLWSNVDLSSCNRLD